MSLTSSQLKYLRNQAQTRKPVVTLGMAGLTSGVLNEIEIALAHHELLKIKLPAGDRQTRQALTAQICSSTAAEAVQTLGRMAIIYRRAEQPRLSLPA